MRAGIWLAGARGSVAVTTIVGALALRTGLTDPVGCVTAHPELAVPGLPDVADLVFGGHDLDTSPLGKRAEQLAAAGVLPARLAAALGPDLAEVEANLRPVPEAATQGQLAAAVAADLTEFAGRRPHPVRGDGGQGHPARTVRVVTAAKPSTHAAALATRCRTLVRS